MSAPFVWWRAGSSRSRREDLGHVARPEDLLAENAVLARELLDLLEAGLVDLPGGSLEGRVVADHPVVGIVAVGQPAQPDVGVLAGVGPDAIADRVAVAGHRRADVRLDDVAQPGAPGIGVGDAGGLGGLQERVLGDRLRQPGDRSGDGVVDREGGRGPVPGDALEERGRSCRGSSARSRGPSRSSPRRRRHSGSGTSASGPAGRPAGRRSGRRRTPRSGRRGRPRCCGRRTRSSRG